MDPDCARDSHLTPVWKGTSLMILYMIKVHAPCVLSVFSEQSLWADRAVSMVFHSQPPWPFSERNWDQPRSYRHVPPWHHDIHERVQRGSVPALLQQPNGSGAEEARPRSEPQWQNSQVSSSGIPQPVPAYSCVLRWKLGPVVPLFGLKMNSTFCFWNVCLVGAKKKPWPDLPFWGCFQVFVSVDCWRWFSLTGGSGRM